MHGIGNDYIFIDGFSKGIDNPSQLSIKLSDRHFGIGSDGLVLILPSDVADCKMDMYNADGSQAEMCGNAIRCVGKYLYDQRMIDDTKVTVETKCGIKKLKLNFSKGIIKDITVDMGAPELSPGLIPVDLSSIASENERKVDSKKNDSEDEKTAIAKENANEDASSESAAFDGTGNESNINNAVNDFHKARISVEDKVFDMTFVSMGNPHAVIFVDDVMNFDVHKYGRIIEKHSIFPNKTNVEFVEIIDDKTVRMRVWERGSGETLACGTGSCATVVACILNGKTSSSVRVKLIGGDLDIVWDGGDSSVFMTGPAKEVFWGYIDPESL